MLMERTDKQKHLHRLEHIKDPVYRYRCITCGDRLKIASGVLVKQEVTEVPHTWHEHLQGVDGVRSTTIVGSNAVYYGVEVYDTEWVEVWQMVVEFAQDKAHRPAGAAFYTAALEQQHQLQEAVKLVPHAS